MKAHHFGLACSSEKKADGFYENLLGLKRLERKTVPAALCGTFFGIPHDMVVLNYVSGEDFFEVFIHQGERPAAASPAHICLEVEDLEAFLERCRAMDVPVMRAARGDRWITFIQDFDGNRFEIKEGPAQGPG